MPSSHHRKTMKKTSMASDKKCCEATYMGLHKWYVKMFEQVGWMLLARDKGLTDKIKAYKESVKRLKSSIEMKIEKIHEEDRKDDLKIMWKNVCVLINHLKHI